MVSSTPNGLTKYRVDELEKKVNRLDENVEKILTNHLPHLSQDMIGLRTQINIMTAFNIGAIILGVIVSKILQ